MPGVDGEHYDAVLGIRAWVLALALIDEVPAWWSNVLSDGRSW
jgi:hypothetical protein